MNSGNFAERMGWFDDVGNETLLGTSHDHLLALLLCFSESVVKKRHFRSIFIKMGSSSICIDTIYILYLRDGVDYKAHHLCWGSET